MASNNRTKMLYEHYINAKYQGLTNGFDIEMVNPDNPEHYYILLKPQTGLYKDQWQVMEMKTKYSNHIYNMQSPLVKFVSKVYHTNISTSGSICLDILTTPSKWQPTYDFSQIIFNIILLYQTPNNASPFNGAASRNYVECEKEFKSKVKKGMDMEEEEKIRELCFRKFKITADNYASTKEQIEQKYSRWFPQIATGQMPKEQVEFIKDAHQALIDKKLKAKKDRETAKQAKEKVKKSKPRWKRHQKK